MKISSSVLLVGLSLVVFGCATTPTEPAYKSNKRVNAWTVMQTVDIFINECESRFDTKPAMIADARKVKNEWLKNNPDYVFSAEDEKEIFTQILMESGAVKSEDQLTPAMYGSAKKLLLAGIIQGLDEASQPDNEDDITFEQMCTTMPGLMVTGMLSSQK